MLITVVEFLNSDVQLRRRYFTCVRRRPLSPINIQTGKIDWVVSAAQKCEERLPPGTSKCTDNIIVRLNWYGIKCCQSSVRFRGGKIVGSLETTVRLVDRQAVCNFPRPYGFYAATRRVNTSAPSICDVRGGHCPVRHVNAVSRVCVKERKLFGRLPSHQTFQDVRKSWIPIEFG